MCCGAMLQHISREFLMCLIEYILKTAYLLYLLFVPKLIFPPFDPIEECRFATHRYAYLKA